MTRSLVFTSSNRIIEMSKSLFSFGLITDVQYADADDGMNYARTRHRYYRKALKCLESAVNHWNAKESTSFILQLGDILDGYCRRHGDKYLNLEQLADTMRSYQKPIAHCWGNHELYNFYRKELVETIMYPKMKFQTNVTLSTDLMEFYSPMTLKEDQLCCYHFSPHPGFRFIIIDCYDISALGHHQDHPKKIIACDTLNEMNPNRDKNNHNFALERKYVQYNGAVSKDQLQWLDEVLDMSDSLGERVVLCGHIPIDPKVTGIGTCLLWNNDEMLKLCEKHPSIVAYFAGHDHEGASYYCDKNGVHQCTFESVLEAVPKHLGGNDTAFATIDVFPDRMEVRGVGDIKSRTMNFR